MRKRLIKSLAMLCMTACMTLSVQFPGYAALTYENENSVCYVTNHPYYQEVSEMAKTVSEKLPEAEREFLYHACMVSVFGANYKNSKSDYLSDLLCILSPSEVESIHSPIFMNYIQTGLVAWSNGRQEVRTITPVSLNENGINEANYQELRLFYQTYLEAQQKMQGLDTASKIRALHDMLIEKMDTPSMHNLEETTRAHGMGSALADHIGLCNVYSGMFYIFGNANGLQVTIDHDHINHDCNMVYVDGKWKYIDVMYDDIDHSTKYYLTETCARAKEHTKPVQ